MKLSVCKDCGNSITTKAVSSWQDVNGGREMFWSCPSCGKESSMVLSTQVLNMLSPKRAKYDNEVAYFASLLEDVNDIGDIWEWDLTPAPKDVVDRGSVG